MALNIDSLFKRGLNIKSVRPYAPTISTCTTVSSLDEIQFTPVYSSYVQPYGADEMNGPNGGVNSPLHCGCIGQH